MSLHHEPFDGTEETIQSRLISDQELQAVLQAIEEEQFVKATHDASPYDEWVTVDAICEATGHNPTEVSRILYQHRRAILASRISERLRELEEPLYRVERPGHHKPDSSAPVIRVEQINTILDKLLPKQSYTRKSKALQTTLSDRVASAIALFIGAIVVLGTLALIIQGIISQ